MYDCHEPYDLLSRVVVHGYRVMGAALRILRTSEEAKASRNKARNESTSRSELFHLPKPHQVKVFYLCVSGRRDRLKKCSMNTQLIGVQRSLQTDNAFFCASLNDSNTRIFYWSTATRAFWPETTFAPKYYVLRGRQNSGLNEMGAKKNSPSE